MYTRQFNGVAAIKIFTIHPYALTATHKHTQAIRSALKTSIDTIVSSSFAWHTK